MTQGSEGDNPSPTDHKDAKNASGEKSQVARTKLDINMDDLIDPLHGQLHESDSTDDAQHGESKVAKTMLESDGPTLKQIKELSDSGKYSIPSKSSDSSKNPAQKSSDSGKKSPSANLSDSEVESLSAEDFKALRKELAKTLPESATLKNRSQVEQSIREEAAEARKKKLETEKAKQEKKSVQATPEKAHLSKLAKTIPEAETRKKKGEADTSKQADEHQDSSSLKKLATTIPESETREKEGEDENVPLKELAKTIPDPPMQERIAVAKRIARIRSFQKTVQVKSIKFSKTMTQANLEKLENLHEGSQWKPPSESSTRKKPYVQEQFIAKTKLDHDILFQAVSTSKIREEAKVAAFLVEKSKEAPKPPPVAVKADKQSSACPFKWEETDSKEKYRYCTKCQTAVYNFDGMERPEAEALIFNRENRDKFTLYSRPDGKFTTIDCPLQKKRQRDFIMGLIVAVAVLIGVVGLLLLTPQTPPTPTVNTSPGGSTLPGGSTSPDGSTSPGGSADSSGTADTSGGAEVSPDTRTFSSLAKERPTATKKVSAGSGANGGGLQTFQLPSAKQQAAQTHDPDEDGSNWKF